MQPEKETVEVYLPWNDELFECAPNQTLLDAGLSYGLEYSCRVGMCLASCYRAVDEDGRPVTEAVQPGSRGLSESEKQEGYVLACMARFPAHPDDPNRFPEDFDYERIRLEREFPPSIEGDIADALEA